MALSKDSLPDKSPSSERAGPIRGARAWSPAILYGGLTTATLFWGIPFASSGPVPWEDLNGALLAGTAALAVAIFWVTAVNFSIARAVAFGTLAFFISWGAEAAGTQTPYPFGYQYTYHPALKPILPGDVPLFIPLAWWVLASTPLVLLRGMTLCDEQGSPRTGRLVLKAALAAVYLAGCDLVLDPLAMTVEAWEWHHQGSYFGTPYLNYLGWFLVGLAIYLCYFWMESIRPRPNVAPPSFLDFAWMIGNLACLALVAVAAYNRIPSLLPTVLWLVVIGPFWATWLYRLRIRPAAAEVACSVAVEPLDG